MASWFPCNDSDYMLRKGILTVVTYQPYAEANAPQDVSKCGPPVKLLTVRLLMAAVRTSNLTERNDAAGKPLFLYIMLVLDKARPSLTFRECVSESLASAGFSHVEYEDALRRKRFEHLTK